LTQEGLVHRRWRAFGDRWVCIPAPKFRVVHRRLVRQLADMKALRKTLRNLALERWLLLKKDRYDFETKN
jgi:hypothetical protein